jgi:hypothetical protein
MGRFYLGLAILALSTTAARAESPATVSFDLGYLWDRVAITDHTTIDGQAVRFGFRVGWRYVHFGAEVDDSTLAGSTQVPDGAIARTMTVPAGSPLSGTMVAPKVVFGVHTRARAFSVAADLAGGVRDTGVDSDYGNDVGGRKMEPLLEARSRVDFWMSPSWTIGAIASTDMLVRNDLAVGVMLATHMR